MLKKGLKKHDIVDIVFPATCCFEDEIEQIKNYIKSLGLTPRILEEKHTTPKKTNNCALPTYSAKARFKQLYQALKNPQSKLVWCARGGYGSADLLPLLRKAQPIKQNKMFIGFSDLTSIASFLQDEWGWQIVYGPMPIQLIKNGKLKVNKKSCQEIVDIIFGKKTKFSYNLISLNPTPKKPISTEIAGGCLSVLAGNCGGNGQINFADKILFLEDIEETAEKLDRYFFQIIQIILKTKKPPAAILLGEFDYGIKDKIFKANIKIAIKKLIENIAENNLKIPVFQAKEALGHSDKMHTVMLGVKSIIDTKKLLLQNQI